MVFGDPASIADQRCASPQVSMITVTGGTEVGKQLGAKAALHMKKATLELGGHAPVVIWNDVDIDKVAAACVATKYRNAGKVCTSPTRFLVHKDIFEAFSERFAAHANTLRVLDPLAPLAQMETLQNQRRLSQIHGLLCNAVESDAQLFSAVI